MKLLINWSALFPCDWYLAAGSGMALPQCLRNIIYGRVTEIWLLLCILVRSCGMTFINGLAISQRTEN